ncbi:MAG: hypothetical protein C5B47_05415 [Verrucomicrobia bacterium]|nr:MAG: hypothetical protein C5B47_05415 [Verrucomicrobiota bacterium]
MSLSPVNERRSKLRKKPLRLVYVELALGNGGMMRDLSEEGFAVRAMMPVRQGDKTAFSFMLGDAARIEGEGKILWIEEGGRVAGVEFLQISPEMRTRIDDWLIEDEKIEDPRETPPEKEPAIAPAATIEELREELRSVPARVEETPTEVERSEPASNGEPKIESLPSVEAKAKIEPPIAIEPIAETGVLHPEKTRPAAEETGAAAKSSVTEGFFRKWPTKPRPSSEVRNPIPSVPPLTRTPIHPLSEPDSSAPEAEFTHEQSQGTQQLPDISEILIQPDTAGGRNTTTRALPELPQPTRMSRRGLEWFTLRRALFSMIALMVLAGMYVYHSEFGSLLIGLGEAMGGVSTANPPAAPPGNTTNSGGGDAANSPNSVRPNSDNARAPESPASNNNTQSTLSGAPQATPAPVTPLGGIATQTSPDASSDAGEAEYSQAAQILRGRNASVDTPEAVRLLWIAVEKGNPGAEVTLADLYWHGRGVARNCDQTRILLTAAARKGSAEAQKRLQQFQREGCE